MKSRWITSTGRLVAVAVSRLVRLLLLECSGMPKPRGCSSRPSKAPSESPNSGKLDLHVLAACKTYLCPSAPAFDNRGCVPSRIASANKCVHAAGNYYSHARNKALNNTRATVERLGEHRRQSRRSHSESSPTLAREDWSDGAPSGSGITSPWHLASACQNSLSDLVFVEEMSNFKSPGCWSFLELCDAVRLLKCR